MREILFKAKRIDNGKWIEGYYQKRHERFGEIKHYIFWTQSYTVWEYAEIDPKTLCQYTELDDNYSNRIWENDIVLIREEIQCYEWKSVVKFGNPNGEYNWGWQLVPIGECKMNKDILLWVNMDFSDFKVIGNVFDNPELLERS